MSELVSAPVLFALAAAVAWGAGDFCGGLAARRAYPPAVVFGVQVVGALLLTALAFLSAEVLPPAQTWMWAALGGLAGTVGLVSLYAGLASGSMGVVAPVSGVVGASVPIVVAAVLEGLPGLLPLAGFGLALLAVWLMAGGGGGISLSVLGLPLLAGAGFGLYFVFLAQAAQGALWWPLVISRTLSSLLLLPLIWRRMRRTPGIERRPLQRAAPAAVVILPLGVLPLVALGGMLDSTGNLAYALATQAGRMDTAAVLSSLFPAVTVGLAWLLLHERLSRPQWTGVALALLAIPLIAA